MFHKCLMASLWYLMSYQRMCTFSSLKCILTTKQKKKMYKTLELQILQSTSSVFVCYFCMVMVSNGLGLSYISDVIYRNFLIINFTCFLLTFTASLCAAGIQREFSSSEVRRVWCCNPAWRVRADGRRYRKNTVKGTLQNEKSLFKIFYHCKRG